MGGMMFLGSFFGQTFELHDLFVVGLLVLLEGVLSIDNALVLGLLAKRLPKHLQSRALTYGLVGAFVFRIAAIGTASFLLRWTFAKFLGGAYLLSVAGSHFFSRAPAAEAGGELVAGEPGEHRPVNTHSALFWKTVIVIEITDIAFAVDSIVAAMALVGQQKASDTGTHDKLWVVVTGGMIGVIVMRFAAVLFIKLLDKFPRFETSAYLLVLAIGTKLLVDWWFNKPENEWVNFHSPQAAAFWIFWSVMGICFCLGFIPHRAGREARSEK